MPPSRPPGTTPRAHVYAPAGAPTPGTPHHGQRPRNQSRPAQIHDPAISHWSKYPRRRLCLQPQFRRHRQFPAAAPTVASCVIVAHPPGGHLA